MADHDEDWWAPPSTAQMSANTWQCTSPERMEKLLEIEKAVKWLRFWSNAREKYCCLIMDIHLYEMFKSDYDNRSKYHRALKHYNKAIERLVE